MVSCRSGNIGLEISISGFGLFSASHRSVSLWDIALKCKLALLRRGRRIASSFSGIVRYLVISFFSEFEWSDFVETADFQFIVTFSTFELNSSKVFSEIQILRQRSHPGYYLEKQFEIPYFKMTLVVLHLINFRISWSLIESKTTALLASQTTTCFKKICYKVRIFNVDSLRITASLKHFI